MQFSVDVHSIPVGTQAKRTLPLLVVHVWTEVDIDMKLHKSCLRLYTVLSFLSKPTLDTRGL